MNRNSYFIIRNNCSVASRVFEKKKESVELLFDINGSFRIVNNSKLRVEQR